MSIQITVITSIPDSPFYGISLHHILSLIKPQDNQRWSILNFDQTWVVAERWQNPDVTFSQIIDDAMSNPGGYAVTWEQLTQIASAIFQTICCMIVAVNENTDVGPLSFLDTDEKLHDICDIVIECDDGYYWSIYARHEDHVQALVSSFSGGVGVTVDRR